MIAGRIGFLTVRRINPQGWSYILLGVYGWGHPILLHLWLSLSLLSTSYAYRRAEIF
jgi:hypothetical protein